jgi:hypothetical protein
VNSPLPKTVRFAHQWNDSTINFSPYPATATHLWTCTDGFTSTQQNPTFNPIADVTCSLTATESGCTATSQSIVDVCDCACNENACIAMNYNSSTECVTFANTGTHCSPLAY